jgi:hypothetical protein
MKTLKKITLSFLTLLTLSTVFGHLYFEEKFTPEENYLIVKNQSGKIPITWHGSDKNALLIPIHFEGDTAIYYLQFDTGSPYTLFYKKAVEKLQQIKVKNETTNTTFFIGQTKVTSKNFKIINHGKKNNKKDSVRIIGTLGSDILDKRRSIINFKESFIELNLVEQPTFIHEKLIDFEFKKRKIIIAGILKNRKQNFLYDSGTSGYHLLTNKETWNNLKINNSKINIEKASSWENSLTTYTAESNSNLKLNKKNLRIKTVTYVEGFSKMQYLLMKFSGMQGMLGNKFFLGNTIYIDCSVEKIAIY